jgi:streptogramin lyase
MKLSAVAPLLLAILAGVPAPAAHAARTFTTIEIGSPRAIAVDRAGTLYVVDVDRTAIHQITAAGAAAMLPIGPIKSPFAVAVGGAGAIYVADDAANAVYKLGPNGDVKSLATSGDPTGMNVPTSLAVDSKGNVFVTDNGNGVIRKISSGGELTTFAGDSREPGNADGRGTQARFRAPRGIAIDPRDNLYVADEANSNIRKLTPDGAVSTLAGSSGAVGTDDGTGPAARFGAPRALAADSAGNVYVADTDNHTIRKITPAGAVTTLAGRPGQSGFADGAGTQARFSEPRGIAVDAAGNVFVADTGNAAVRQITPDGVVTTIAAAKKP